MRLRQRWYVLAAAGLLAVAIQQSANAQVVVSQPVVSYYTAPVVVAQPAVSYYVPPAVSYYTPAPVVAAPAPVVAAPAVRYYTPAPVVSYRATSVTYPISVSRGLFGRTIVRSPFYKLKY